jgi:hypothetical protein
LALSVEFHLVPDIDKFLFTKSDRMFAMLCEWSSLRSIARMVNLSFNSVVRLLKVSSEAREACRARAVRAPILLD